MKNWKIRHYWYILLIALLFPAAYLLVRPGIGMVDHLFRTVFVVTLIWFPVEFLMALYSRDHRHHHMWNAVILFFLCIFSTAAVNRTLLTEEDFPPPTNQYILASSNPTD